MQVSGSLLQMFSQWQQGALQQLKHSIESLSQRTGQRAKVTAPPTESDDESDAETQVSHHVTMFVGGCSFSSQHVGLLSLRTVQLVAVATEGHYRPTNWSKPLPQSRVLVRGEVVT